MSSNFVNLQLSTRPDVIIGKDIRMRPVIDVIRNLCPESEVSGDVLTLPLKYESHLKYWFASVLNTRDDRTMLGMLVPERDKLRALVQIWPQFSESDVPSFVVESVVRFQTGHCIVHKTKDKSELSLILDVLTTVYKTLNKSIEIEVKSSTSSDLPLIELTRTEPEVKKFIF